MCERCHRHKARSVRERANDYAAFIASRGYSELCERCDGELHWEFAEAVRVTQEALEGMDEKEPPGHSQIAGAVGVDSSSPLWPGGAGGGHRELVAGSPSAMGEGVVGTLSQAAPRGSDGQAQSLASDEGRIRFVPGSQDAPRASRGVRVARLDPDDCGLFDIIYADPPWFYREKIHLDGYEHSAADYHYETMRDGDLGGIPVINIASDDCLLFLWATGPKMDTAITTGTAWGFKFITVGFVWEKKRTNAGHYTLSSTEFCLIFKHGRIPRPRGARNIRQFLSRSPREHSRKPYEIRQRIDQMFPKQRKIELFARGAVAPGWHAYGDEVQE